MFAWLMQHPVYIIPLGLLVLFLVFDAGARWETWRRKPRK